MTTATDIMDILYTKLQGSAIATAITGSISKFRREPGSFTEDIVVNSLPAPNTQLQRIIANVNIHVPDLQITANNQQDRQPNLKRLDALTVIALGILEDQWTATMNYDVQSVGILEDEDRDGHYSNLRIEFFIENIK